MKKFRKRVIPLVICLCLILSGHVGTSLAKYIWSQTKTISLSAAYTPAATPTPLPSPTVPPSAPTINASTFKNLDKQQANHIRFIDISKGQDKVTYQSGRNGNLAYVTTINGNKVIPAGKKDDYPATQAGTGVYYYTNDTKFSSGSKECSIFNCPSCGNNIGKKDIGYFISNGPIYLPEDCTSIFSGISSVSDCNAHVIDFTNVNTSCVKKMNNMFEQCKVYVINMETFTMESLGDISGMFKNCSNLTTVRVTALNGTDRSTGFEPGKLSGGITLGTDTFNGCTKLSYRGSGTYAKVIGGNFVSSNAASAAYMLNTTGLENISAEAAEMTAFMDGAASNLVISFYPDEGFTMPEFISVSIGGVEYLIATGGENEYDALFYDAESATLYISGEILRGEIIISAKAVEVNKAPVVDYSMCEHVTVSHESGLDGLNVHLIAEGGYTLPEFFAVYISDNSYLIYTTADMAAYNPLGFVYDSIGQRLFISAELLPSDGSSIYIAASAAAIVPDESTEEDENTEGDNTGEEAPEDSDETPTVDSGDTPSEDSGETPSEDTGEAPPEDTGETPPVDSGDTPSEDSGEAPPEDTGETPPEDTGETPPADSGDTPSEDGGEAPPEDTGETPPEDTGEAPPADTGETPPADSGTTVLPEYVLPQVLPPLVDSTWAEHITVRADNTDIGLCMFLTPEYGYILPDSFSIIIGENIYYIYTSAEMAIYNPAGFIYSSELCAVLIETPLVPIDGTVIYVSGAAVLPVLPPVYTEDVISTLPEILPPADIPQVSVECLPEPSLPESEAIQEYVLPPATIEPTAAEPLVQTEPAPVTEQATQ